MALSPNMNVMLRAVEKASRSLVRDFGEVEQLQVSQKGPADFVTAADLRSEEILHYELSKARPDFGFLMEERGEIKGKANSRWIVDPLDGTINFLHGIPHWNITVALEENGEIVAGIIYDPIRDEMFRAEKGLGAFIRNKRLRVSGRKDLKSGIVAAGLPFQNEVDGDPFMEQIRPVLKTTQRFRSLGAGALDLAYVAAGRFEGYWEYNMKPWDIAAGSLIVREAGGMISCIHSENNPVYGNDVIAANNLIFNDLKKILNDAVPKKKDAA